VPVAWATGFRVPERPGRYTTSSPALGRTDRDQVSQDGIQWQALVNMEMNLQGIQKVVNVLFE
jgi:hypothetical protein